MAHFHISRQSPCADPVEDCKDHHAYVFLESKNLCRFGTKCSRERYWITVWSDGISSSIRKPEKHWHTVRHSELKHKNSRRSMNNPGWSID